MTRATRELLTALAKVNQQVPTVALGILDESLSPDKQAEFGDLLIVAGEALRRHAQNERVVVVESGTGHHESKGKHELGSRHRR
jgi:hypothetical protein